MPYVGFVLLDRLGSDRLLTFRILVSLMVNRSQPVEPLRGEQALALWKQGHEAWNARVKASPQMEVDFSGIRFSDHWRPDSPPKGFPLPFARYLFPAKGDVTFDRAVFGKEGVSFEGVQFGTGVVSFKNVVFSGGPIIFEKAVFGGPVSFSESKFLNPDDRTSFSNVRFDKTVSFLRAEFEGREVSFTKAEFHMDGVNFRWAKFDAVHIVFNSIFLIGEATFASAIFKGERLYFRSARFAGGAVNFESTRFDSKEVRFQSAEFGDGGCVFRSAHFGAELVTFKEAVFGSGKYIFQDALFTGRVDLGDLRKVSKVKEFDFRFCKFDGAFSLSAVEPFGCVPDFVGTKTSITFP